MAKITIEYNVTHDGGQTWVPHRSVYTGVRNLSGSGKPGEGYQVMFLADACEDSEAIDA